MLCIPSGTCATMATASVERKHSMQVTTERERMRGHVVLLPVEIRSE